MIILSANNRFNSRLQRYPTQWPKPLLLSSILFRVTVLLLCIFKIFAMPFTFSIINCVVKGSVE